MFVLFIELNAGFVRFCEFPLLFSGISGGIIDLTELIWRRGEGLSAGWTFQGLSTSACQAQLCIVRLYFQLHSYPFELNTKVGMYDATMSVNVPAVRSTKWKLLDVAVVEFGSSYLISSFNFESLEAFAISHTHHIHVIK